MFMKRMLNTIRITALDIRDFAKTTKDRGNALREDMVNKGS